MADQGAIESGFFSWSMVLGKILFMNNIRKRHAIVVDCYYMCKGDGESMDHLLHCEVACTLWSAFFSCFGLSRVMSRRVANLYACWWMGGSSQNAVVWKMVPSCFLWCL